MTIRFESTLMLLAAFLPAVAMGSTLSSVEERDALRQADSEYHSALKRCKALDSQAKAKCEADAQAARKQTRTGIGAAYGESEAKRRAQSDEAKADFLGAKARCDRLEGPEKTACVNSAKTAMNDQRARSNDQAGEERMEANFRAELRGCDSLPAREKSTCAATAMAKYGK